MHTSLFIRAPLNVSFRNKPVLAEDRFGRERAGEDLLSRLLFRFVWVAGAGMQTPDEVYGRTHRD